MEDDLPPPLEDCSDRLQSLNTKYRQKGDDCKNASPSEVQIKQLKKKKKKTTKKQKNRKTDPFRSGFLLAKPKKSKKKRGDAKLEVTAKQNQLLIPEAQQKLKQTEEGEMAQIAEKLHKDQDVWKAMMDPKFGEAMQELSVNPTKALQKYQNDPAILPTLSKIVGTMYGQSLDSISRDIQKQVKSQRDNSSTVNGSSNLYDTLKIFNKS